MAAAPALYWVEMNEFGGEEGGEKEIGCIFKGKTVKWKELFSPQGMVTEREMAQYDQKNKHTDLSMR